MGRPASAPNIGDTVIRVVTDPAPAISSPHSVGNPLSNFTTRTDKRGTSEAVRVRPRGWSDWLSGVTLVQGYDRKLRNYKKFHQIV